MLLAPLAGAALVMSIATGPAVEPQRSMTQMTAQQKNAVMQPLVRSATECIARAVAGTAGFSLPPDVSPGLEATEHLVIDDMTQSLGGDQGRGIALPRPCWRRPTGRARR